MDLRHEKSWTYDSKVWDFDSKTRDLRHERAIVTARNIILMERNIVFNMIITQKSFISNDKLNVSFTYYDR